MPTRTRQGARFALPPHSATTGCATFAPLPTTHNDDIEVLGGREIACPHLERGGGNLLHAIPAEADNTIGLALVDDNVEILDRTGPICAGLHHVADASFQDLRLVGFVSTGKLVDRL